MGKPLGSQRVEWPYQLCGDLRTPLLKPFSPIEDAAHEVRHRERQRRDGILRLDECHTEGERG